MTDDLVKRLREVGGMSDDGATRWYINPDGPEAADRIEKLEAALDDAVQYVSRADWHYLKAANRIEKLEAALRFYACDCKPDDGCGIEYYDGGAYCGHAARKALEGKND